MSWPSTYQKVCNVYICTCIYMQVWLSLSQKRGIEICTTALILLFPELHAHLCVHMNCYCREEMGMFVQKPSYMTSMKILSSVKSKIEGWEVSRCQGMLCCNTKTLFRIADTCMASVILCYVGNSLAKEENVVGSRQGGSNNARKVT